MNDELAKPLADDALVEEIRIGEAEMRLDDIVMATMIDAAHEYTTFINASLDDPKDFTLVDRAHQIIAAVRAHDSARCGHCDTGADEIRCACEIEESHDER